MKPNWGLTCKQLKVHGCILSTVDTGSLVLKYQAIHIHAKICIVSDQFHTKFPTQRPVTRSFDVFFYRVWIKDWVNNRETGDLRRHRGHYDVNVM